jgi:hypothetical protein
MDRMQFREAKAANLVLRGNAYSLKERAATGVSSLYPIPSRSNCTQERDAIRPARSRFIVMDRGKREVYPRRRSGASAASASTAWSASRRSATAGMRSRSPPRPRNSARGFSERRARLGVVKIPQWLEDEQRERRKRTSRSSPPASTTRIDQAPRGRHGIRGDQRQAGEAQHNELRGFQIPDICRFFGVPPHLAFDLTNGSYNNVETLASEFVTFGLLPHLVRFELAAQKQLLKPAIAGKFFVRFNFEGLLRANSLERAQFYAAMLQNGVLSRNEVREKENLNRIDAPAWTIARSRRTSRSFNSSRRWSRPAPRPAATTIRNRGRQMKKRAISPARMEGRARRAFTGYASYSATSTTAFDVVERARSRNSRARKTARSLVLHAHRREYIGKASVKQDERPARRRRARPRRSARAARLYAYEGRDDRRR